MGKVRYLSGQRRVEGRSPRCSGPEILILYRSLTATTKLPSDLSTFSAANEYEKTDVEEKNMERIQISDVAQIYELWNAFAAAANDGDLGGWISLWIDDGIQMPPGAPRRVGKEQIRQEMKPLFDSFDTSKMTIHTEEVRIIGYRAYSHGTYEFEMTPKEGGDTMEVAGKFLTILEKQADSSWKLAIDCFNYDAPPA